MRIVYVISGLSTGGAEIMLLNLLQALDRGRFSPYVISLTTAGEIGPKILDLGIPVVTIDMAPSVKGLLQFFYLIKVIKNIRPDIVHTWMYHADFLGGVAARLAGVSRICWGVRSSNLDTDKTSKSTRVVRRVCAYFSHVIPRVILFNSLAASSIHKSLGYAADKRVVIPNGIDLKRFVPDPAARIAVRSEIGIDGEAHLVGMVGRFDPLKNHIGFCEAMAILQSRMPGIKFLLAGKGIDYENKDLVNEMMRQGVFGSVYLLGLRDDIPRLMASIDVLACPSYAEAFPNAVAEAMACGAPCVVTDTGDSAYLVGEAGRLVRVGDMLGMATQIESILMLSPVEKNKLGAHARSRILNKFSIEEVAKKYRDIYEILFKDL